MNELYSVKWIICVASASFEFRIFSTILTFFFGIEWNLISIRHPNRIRTLICAIIKHEYILHNAHKQRNMIRIRQIIPNSKKWKRFFFLHCAQILTEATSAMTFSSHKEPRLTLERNSKSSGFRWEFTDMSELPSKASQENHNKWRVMKTKQIWMRIA